MGRKIRNAFITLLAVLVFALVGYFLWQQGVFDAKPPFEAPGR